MKTRGRRLLFALLQLLLTAAPAWAQSSPVKITVQGCITDTDGDPLPGAGVIVRGTRIGVSSDEEGRYNLTFTLPASGQGVLQFSFIGMETQEHTVRSSTALNVQLKSDTALEAVVVNGFYDQKKETFTGSATVISGEELIEASPTNLIAGIAAMTPGMVIRQNNALGSDPNAIPSILIRGANTLITNESEEGVNNPLIVLDGVEISMEELYDLDIFDIERVDVLKDASATILYGEKGSNGVIVVERKRIGNEKVKLSYNFVPKFSYPDLSSFNLTNAGQKLEFERLSGLYESADGSLDQAYDYKLQNVPRGVNTDWLSTPLRIPFSHTHSLSLSSRGEKLDFSAIAHLNDTYGVMKGDNRRGYGINFTISYHLRDKLTLSYKNNFSLTDSKSSPYGNFAHYARMNPYEPIYDEDGELRKYIPFNPYSSSTTVVVNPLYDATTASFSTSRSLSDNNSLSARYNISKYFYLTAQGNLNLSWGTSDDYVSPETGAQLLITEITKRGSYSFSSRNSQSAGGKVVLNYGRSLDTRGSMFRVSAGSDAKYTRSRSSSAAAEGFLKDNLSDIKFALAYDSGRPSGSDNISTSAGFFVNGNAGFRNRYFVDLSYRTSGSSKFGSANSFAPFWAAGLGWNIHNEAFARNWKWLNSLVLRASSGYTGNVSFSYYQAKTIYEYKSGNLYYTGIGALPKQMGNPDLKWQRTLNNNLGLTAALLNNRVNLSLDYYINTTHDMVMSIDLPPSVGTSSMSVNFGQLTNQGIDLALSAQLLRTRDWFWNMTLNGGHVMDRIEHIAESMKNTEVDDPESAQRPKILFREGGSQFDIYAMRSAGIDPATGQEIFIRRNGEYTYRYIAGRLYRDYPDLFKGETRAAAVSTVSHRVIVSMFTFLSELRDRNPDFRFAADYGPPYQQFLLPDVIDSREDWSGSAEKKFGRFRDDVLDLRGMPGRWFTCPDSLVSDPYRFCQNLHTVVSTLDNLDVPGPEELYRLFTPDERYRLWRVSNFRAYQLFGLSPDAKNLRARAMQALLDDILDRAEEDWKDGISLRLRFTHDSALAPLLSWMDVNGMGVRVRDPYEVENYWRSYDIPMACNLQFLFFRHRKNPQEVLVQVLLNGEEATLPLPEAAPGGFYRWTDFQSRYRSAILSGD